MWPYKLSAKAVAVLVSALLVCALIVDLFGFSAGFNQKYFAGGSFAFSSFLVAAYFAGMGALIRFTLSRDAVPRWAAVSAALFSWFGWIAILEALDLASRPGIFFMLSLLLCYKILRLEKATRPAIKSAPALSEPVASDTSDPVGRDAAMGSPSNEQRPARPMRMTGQSAAITQPPVSFSEPPPVGGFSRPSSAFRKLTGALIMAAAVLCLSFPFYTQKIIYRFDRVVDQIQCGPRFFMLSPPIPTFDGAEKQDLRQEWTMDWSRTIHAFLWLSSVAIGVTWLGLAIAKRRVRSG
jgi:hypothetical protein